ncbi:wiskott-Aldrich syndrome protein family member 2-like [Schistocerca cancellata]|uniref:wiskott-Aldrich syndrome protein family member 2-like n=1 Tax=Schistocerca cancellata TaxID=274614 RepID=UPI0021187C8F|nr:wiskott-Aldrich syndrome protein family member 2-like [Schistocerca cancellata]
MRTLALVLLLATASLAQYNGNYLDSDYQDYQEPAPSRPAPPPPPPQRSYSRPPQQSSPVRSSFSSSAANAARPTPVPILKQINRHNEDGSYTYGYEGADGSFKIETKLTTGEVMGKYGYVDDNGKVRVVEYGANRFGFQPSGEGITVAPPTLVDETTRKQQPGGGGGLGGRLSALSSDQPEYDDGQYYEPQPPPRPAPRPAPPRPQPAPVRAAPPPPPPPPPRPAPIRQPQSFEQFYESPAPAPAQRFSAGPPSPSRSHSHGPSLGPAPPRAQVPGAVPVGGVVYSEQPRPPRPQPQPQPQPIQHRSPAPVYHSPPPPPPPRPSPQVRQAGTGGGILDQLAKDYALPQSNSAPLTDISFSSFY